MAELFGKVADEKEKKTFKAYAEARNSHAYQVLSIVSKLTSLLEERWRDR
jgi:hypothetical protein